MDYLFEFLFELIFDSTISAARNAKLSKWVRYPAIIIVSLFIVSVIAIIAVAGIMIIIKNEESTLHTAGLILLVMDAVLVISVINKIKKQIANKRKN